MKVYTFGDSHRLHIGYSNLNKDITVIPSYGNSFTMASFGLNKTKLLNIKDHGVLDGDAVVFSFGEIDCRCHLCKPNNIIKYKEIINLNVIDYFEAIKLNVTQYLNLIVMVYNVVPPPKMTPKLDERLGPNSGDAFPTIGTDEERKMVALYTNEILKEHCKKNNYIFFDVYDKYCDENGFLNPELLDSYIHIGNASFASEFLNNLFIKNCPINLK